MRASRLLVVIRMQRVVAVGVLALSLGRVTSGCDSHPRSSTSSAKPAQSGVASPGSSGPSAKPPVQPPTAKPQPVNVLFLTLDSLRADMPWTGYARPIAPNLTEIAKQSVVYPRAYSVASYTAKSVATMLTGMYPSSLYRSGWFFTSYPDANPFLTEILQKAGVHTLSAQAHLYFDRGGKTLNQGFEVWELVKGLTFDAETDNHVTGDKLTDLAISLLGDAKNTGGQFFAWFHYMDPHDQYVKHKESPDFGKKNRDRYDSEVYFTDQQIGRLLQFAKKQPWWPNTALIVSADHGEAFGEHGMYKHAFELWEVLTRVPLLFMLPGAAPRVIEERRSHIDLAPTFAELLGVSLPADNQMVGHSLLKELYGAPAENREPIVLDLPEDSHNPPRRAVISGDYKLIVWGKGQAYQLYNLREDAAESNDLAKQETEKLTEMKAVFDRVWSKIPQLEPFGGMTLKNGRKANGPTKP